MFQKLFYGGYLGESCRDMFQLAPFLMQNQSSSLNQGNSQTTEGDVLNVAEQINGAQHNGTQLQTGDLAFMSELARQIVVNSTQGQIACTAAPQAVPTQNRQMTVAQLMQHQTSKTAEGSKRTSGTRLILPKQYSGLDGKDSLSSTSTQVSSPNPSIPTSDQVAMAMYRQGNQQHNGGGPIRQRASGHRVLRPGIDNFGGLETVANPGVIMHAMELMRSKDKKKRGPKEKETFAVFMYCLPDKASKLPKFSSLDPVERALVEQHQQDGYGKSINRMGFVSTFNVLARMVAG